MRLARVKIDGFRCLSGLDWRPAEGLNVVLGPNEAGKSTLADFIEAMIFGLPGGAGAEEHRPWSGGRFGGRLELDCGRTLVVIQRDFGGGDLLYEEVDTASGQAGQPLSGHLRRGSSGSLAKRYHELLGRHLGFFDEKLFRRSTFVPQDELMLAGRDLSEAAASLRALASGGGSAYDRALGTLETRYRALTSEGDKRRKPGALDELREEKAALAARLRGDAAQSKRVAQLRARIAKRREELAKVRAEAEEAERLAGQVRERAEIHRRREALVAAEEADRARLSAAERTARDAVEAKRRLAAYEDLAGARSDFPELVGRARSSHEGLRRLEAEIEPLQAESPPPYPFARNLALAAGAMLLGGAALAYGVLTSRLEAMLGGAALGLAGLMGAALVLHFRRRSSAQTSGQAASLERVQTALAKARQVHKSSAAQLMAQAGGRVEFTPTAMGGLLRRYSERLELVARLGALEAGMMSDEELAALKERSAESARALAVLDERIEHLDGEIGDAEEEGSSRGGAGARAERRARLAERRAVELHEMEIELASLGSAEAATAWAEERIEELDEMIPRHEARCRALRVARNELAAGIHEFQESHLERLGEMASGNLAVLTRDRYGRVRLDGDTLVPTVTGGGREAISERSLSQGTRAALYLALRLAMGKLISGGRGLPLILDDPLVDLDEERRAAALQLLRSLGETCQVLLLTFDARLADCGAELLRLGP